MCGCTFNCELAARRGRARHQGRKRPLTQVERELISASALQCGLSPENHSGVTPGFSLCRQVPAGQSPGASGSLRRQGAGTLGVGVATEPVSPPPPGCPPRHHPTVFSASPPLVLRAEEEAEDAAGDGRLP